MDKIELPLGKNLEIMISTLFLVRDDDVLPMMSYGIYSNKRPTSN